jgi:glycosyl transferase family 2
MDRRVSDSLRISVIMPVLNGRDILPQSVGALLASDLPREDWEFLLVDDGSTDGTAEWASARVDRVVTVEGGPRGPGFARNVGAVEATGDVIVLVDADVCVRADALRRFREHFSAAADVGAVFGAYDDAPTAPNFLSQYRNLYHRYVHLQGAGDTETFWAGCGAIRRDLFVDLGGFDIEAYPRPQIEDIELGYRVRDAGFRIILDPAIEGTHLKRWTLSKMVKTDLLDRGVPWMRLLLGDGPGGRREATLNVGGAEKFKTAMVGLSCLSAGVGAVLLRPGLLLAAVVPLVVVTMMTLPVYGWFAEQRGVAFALRVVPLNLLYYLISGTSVAIALALHVLDPRPKKSATVTDGDPEG